MIEVLRVANPNACDMPSIHNFMRRAFSFDLVIQDMDAAMAELRSIVAHPTIGLFLVREDGHWAGLGFAEWVRSALNPVCLVAHFYNEGTPQARAALLDALIAYARAGGYTQIMALDTNQKPRAFGRLFKAAGPSRRVGEAFLFDLTKAPKRGD